MSPKAQKTTELRYGPEGLTEDGVRDEEREGVLGGCLWVTDDISNAGIMVPYAPSMPRRFEALEITDDGAFLRRTDGARCRIECHPDMAEVAAKCGTITITESPMDHDNRIKETYGILANHITDNALSMA